MEANESTRNKGVVGVLTSLPAILTALAGLITAVGGLALYHQNHEPGPTSPTSTVTAPPTTNLPPDTRPAPIPATKISASSLRFAHESPQNLDSVPVQSSDPLDQLGSACEAGDVDACATLLSALADGCQSGVGEACDALFYISPSGSDYEAYGATCAYRLSEDTAGKCSDQ